MTCKKGDAPSPSTEKATYSAVKSAKDTSDRTGIPMRKVLAGATGKTGKK